MFSLQNSITFDVVDHIYWFPELIMEDDLFEHEYSKEWQQYLINKNEKYISRVKFNDNKFAFYTPEIVSNVFNICKLLKQPPEVRYLAVDILDCFMSKHFFSVAETFELSKNYSLQDWDVVMERMIAQSLLRILSCIQIAIKYSSNCSVFTNKTVQDLMTYLSYPYTFTKKNIIKSEARIFITLGFQIPNITPLTYVEMFFEELQKKSFYQIEKPLFYRLFNTCINILDISYTYHEQIYSELLNHKSTIEQHFGENKFVALKDKFNQNQTLLSADFIVFAASAFLAAGVLNEVKKEVQKIIFENPTFSFGKFKKVITIIVKKMLNIIFF